VVAKKRAGTYQPGPRLSATAAALSRAEERAAARVQERDRVAQESFDAGAVLHAITELVTSADPADLAPIVVARPGGTNPAADLARVRETLAGVMREAILLVRAPIPVDDAFAALDAFLETVASEYDPDQLLRAAASVPATLPRRLRALPPAARAGLAARVAGRAP